MLNYGMRAQLSQPRRAPLTLPPPIQLIQLASGQAFYLLTAWLRIKDMFVLSKENPLIQISLEFVCLQNSF